VCRRFDSAPCHQQNQKVTAIDEVAVSIYSRFHSRIQSRNLFLNAHLFSDRGALRLILFSIGQKQAGLRLASTLRPLAAFIKLSFGMAARSRELPGRATDPPAECRAERAGGFIAYLIRQLVERHAAAA
jgi:hypothetical protein